MNGTVLGSAQCCVVILDFLVKDVILLHSHRSNAK